MAIRRRNPNRLTNSNGVVLVGVCIAWGNNAIEDFNVKVSKLCLSPLSLVASSRLSTASLGVPSEGYMWRNHVRWDVRLQNAEARPASENKDC